ncbi:MAG: diguanylate cyclase [Zymomonas mobilis]|uniref:ligand-binding sensor domain-containing protein n=1 Tax=Zymomonas mobilis TaxID=542 RepID=UPI0001B705F6|nr:ligand-binding sensor domain-containing diguanylate cyclase [Zymomonas mobilis]ACV76348.1 diguanylate cyclase with beta propeller sensor [Zymomonas mobilis subsp. mobilis NCIMB 11163]
MLANGRPLLSHWEGISSRSANEDVKCRAEKTFHLPGVIDSMHGWQNFQSAFFTDMGAIPNLPQTTVNAIMQDSDGLIWINIANGLFRFDGLHIQLFRPQANQPHSLPDSIIRTMRPQNSGGFLLGTATAGVIRFDPKTNYFDPISSDAPTGRGLSIQVIASDNHNGFWVISDAGIGHLKAGSNSIHYEKKLPFSDKGDIHHITDLLATKDNRLWIASNDGLFFRRKENDVFTALRSSEKEIDTLLTSQITALYQDRDDRLWVGSAFHGGLYMTADGRFYQPKPLKASSPYLNYRSIHGFAELPDNHIWIATMGGGIIDYAFWTAGIKGKLCAPPGEEYTGYVRTWTHNPLNDHSVSGNNILSLMADRDGGIWIATDRGVSRWNPHPSIAFNLPDILVDKNGMISDSIEALLADEKGRIWVGLQNGMINMIDQQRSQIKKISLKGLQMAQPVRAFLQAKDGAILAGSLGLARIDPNDFSTTAIMDDILGKETITALAETKYNLFIGTNSGLYVKDRSTEKVTHFTHNIDDKDSLIGDHIKDIAVRSDEEVWIATTDGISIHDTHRSGFNNLLGKPDDRLLFSHSFVTSLATDNDNSMLVGSFNGISHLFPTKNGYNFNNIYRKNKPSSNEINRLIVDKFGHIWSSSPDGISVFDSVNRQSHFLGQRDHVSSGHFSQRASVLTEDGSILFGGTNGLTVIAPEQILFSPAQLGNGGNSATKIQITALDLNEKTLPFGLLPHTDQMFDIPPGTRSLRVGFILSDYSAPNDVRYSYKLEGIDSEWIRIPDNTPPVAIYTNLPSGHYALHMRAEVLGLHSYQKEARFLFKVAPRWYEHWQIGIAVAALILLALYLAVLFRTFLLERRTRRLQHLVDDRTHELQQANKQLSELANTDVLTGLLNRRALMAKLSELHQDALLNENAISIAMLDVDHFKKINDRYGHLVGDDVMRNAASIIRNNIRQEDFAGRYGGDEFIIAISASIEMSRHIAERIRNEFTKIVIKNGETELKITVSIGLFEITTEESISIALDKADSLLYWAKNNGRNRVES